MAGVMSVNPGVFEIPPASPAAGSYVMNSVALVCVGAVFGDAAFVSHGGLGLSCGGTSPNWPAAMCGNWQAVGFESGLVNRNANCAGGIGGPQLVFGGGTPLSNWSSVALPVATGSVTAACSGGFGTLPEHVTDGSGVFSATLEPVPTSANILGGACSAPNPGPAGPAVLYYCQVFVEGVMVFVQRGAIT